MAARKFKRLSGDQPIVIRKEGTQGPAGKDGLSIVGPRGNPGKDGIGKDGKDGRDGVDGQAPEHEVRNNEVRFRNPDGTWGPWIRAVVSHGGGGPDSFNTYTEVRQATFRVNPLTLTNGTNIFGVDFAGDVTIILPNGIDPRAIIVVKDESDNAGANNITITTES